jgi:hypothetical protein
VRANYDGRYVADHKNAQPLLDELMSEMKCTNCGAENPAGLKFCEQCAAPFKNLFTLWFRKFARGAILRRVR